MHTYLQSTCFMYSFKYYADGILMMMMTNIYLVSKYVEKTCKNHFLPLLLTGARREVTRLTFKEKTKHAKILLNQIKKVLRMQHIKILQEIKNIGPDHLFSLSIYNENY